MNAQGEGGPSRSDELRIDAERGRVLIEESREIVVVIDENDLVVAASRRAREAIDGGIGFIEPNGFTLLYSRGIFGAVGRGELRIADDDPGGRGMRVGILVSAEERTNGTG